MTLGVPAKKMMITPYFRCAIQARISPILSKSLQKRRSEILNCFESQRQIFKQTPQKPGTDTGTKNLPEQIWPENFHGGSSSISLQISPNLQKISFSRCARQSAPARLQRKAKSVSVLSPHCRRLRHTYTHRVRWFEPSTADIFWRISPNLSKFSPNSIWVPNSLQKYCRY